MKNSWTTTFLLFCVAAPAQTINIPDANFKTALLEADPSHYIAIGPENNSLYVDTNNDGEIQQSEAAMVYKLFLPNLDIANLEGIQYFINLVDLEVGQNQLTSFYFPQLMNLERLFCDNNQLVSLNLDGLNLKFLGCSSNQLIMLDLSQQYELVYLKCYDNLLTSLDFSASPLLKDLDCSYNLLTSIDTSNCPLLTTLLCQHNEITVINVDFNQTMSLDISYNQLTSFEFPEGYLFNDINVSGNLYTSLDLKNNTAYGGVYIIDTNLESLKLQNNFPNLSIVNNSLLTVIDYRNELYDGCFDSSPNDDDGLCYYDWEVHDNPLATVCIDDILGSDGHTEFEYFEQLMTFLFGIPVSTNCSLATSENQFGHFSVSPNPAENTVTLDFGKYRQIDTINITNIVSQQIYPSTREINSDSVTLDISGLLQGLYFISVFSDQGKETCRFIKR